MLEPEADGGFVGSSIEMPNVMADGPSPDECVRELRDALAGAVAFMLEEGRPPPEPIDQERRTEQVNIRLTAKEKLILEEASRREGFRSVSEYLRATTLGRSRTA